LALDSIISYSNRPLKLAAAGGFIIAMLSFCYALVLVLQYLLFEQPPAGWTSVIVSLYFIGGLLMANLGIMGLYIGKVFDVARNKPNYVVQETTFDKEIGK
jgi:dolichol-phosphate mannosyltransferase